jgi:hypothetical protein
MSLVVKRGFFGWSVRQKVGVDLTLVGGTVPAAWATPEARSKKKTLPGIPKLVLRCFPVHLKIIPDQVIFQLFEVMREHRFFNNV